LGEEPFFAQPCACCRRFRGARAAGTIARREQERRNVGASSSEGTTTRSWEVHMGRLGLIALAFCVALGTSGCVVGRRSIDLDVPSAQVTVPAAKGTIAIRSITDNRTFENKPASPSTPSIDGDVTKVSRDQLKTMIGRQRNGYGMAMGDIDLAGGGTVELEMRQLLEEGFKRNGYQIVDAASAGALADVTINKFWAWFTPGFWAVDFEAQIDSEMTIVTGDSTRKVVVSGAGKNTGQVASDANWQLAYSRAFDDLLKNLGAELTKAGF
jgi:hypothetical protein